MSGGSHRSSTTTSTSSAATRSAAPTSPMGNSDRCATPPHPTPDWSRHVLSARSCSVATQSPVRGGLARGRHRLDPRLVVTDLRTSEDAQAALTDLMTAADKPTAVFACRNILSIGAIRALHSLGLSHPCRPRGLRRLPAPRPHEPAAHGDPPRRAVHRSAGRRAVVRPDRGRPFPPEASGEHTHAGRPWIRRDPTV